MKVTINNQQENPLLNRVEIRGTVAFNGATPSNSDMISDIATQLKKDTKLIVMKHVYTTFSKQEGVFHAFVYKDAAAYQKAEMMTKHLKKKAEEVKKAADSKAAEEAESAKEAKSNEAEETSEETPEETKVEEPVAAESNTPEPAKEEETIPEAEA